MATIKQWLNEANFDWLNSRIIVWDVADGSSPGWAYEIDPPREAETDDRLLNVEFYSGYGSPQCPRFFARDDNAIYFPSQYDGATRLTRVVIDPQFYLDNPDERSPYPGGG